MAPPTSSADVDLVRIQRRTLVVLSVALLLGGIGIAGAVAAGGLLVADVSGSDAMSGLGQTTMVLGSAGLAVPLAKRSARRGRRSGLVAGFALGAVGAAVIVVGAQVGWWPLVLFGLLLFGGALAAGLQARFAATDLAPPGRVSRHLSLVMWMSAVGAVLGPNLAEPAARTGEALGVPRLSGVFLWSAVAFLIALLLMAALLRPDPLLLAQHAAAQGQQGGALDSAGTGGEGSSDGQGSRTTELVESQAPPEVAAGGAGTGHDSQDEQVPDTREILTGIRARPMAALALGAIVIGHATMIGLMVMTPLHLDHGGSGLAVIGIVISGHVAGMYFFAPLIGILADRWGTVRVIAVGAMLLIASGGLAAAAPGDRVPLVALALFLLGLGWSCTIVAGSALLTASLPVRLRPGAQGVSDLSMGLAAAAFGALAGVIFGVWSFSVLGLVAVAVVAPLAVVTLSRIRSSTVAA